MKNVTLIYHGHQLMVPILLSYTWLQFLQYRFLIRDSFLKDTVQKQIYVQ